MSKRLTQSQRVAQVTNLVDKWSPRFLLQDWYIEIVISGDPHPDEPLRLAQIVPNNRYHRADITVYPLFFGTTPVYREKTIAHELSHCVTEPMRDVAYDLSSGKAIHWDSVRQINETTTDWVAMLLIKAYRKRT